MGSKKASKRVWFYFIQDTRPVSFLQTSNPDKWESEGGFRGPFNTFGEAKREAILDFKDVLDGIRKSKRASAEQD